MSQFPLPQVSYPNPSQGQAPSALPATQLGGALPFQAGGNPFSQDIGQAYQSSYNSALAQNQALYGNILQGYNQVLGNQQRGQQGVAQGYTNLQNQVLGDIQGITAAQSQQIQDVYAQQMGAQQQQLINSGLGNTTIQGTMARGLTLDEQKAQIALANQQSQLTAGYAAQLGSAGLAYQGQAIAANTGEANQALNWMNSVTAAYPNAQSYAQLQYNQGLLNALNGRRGLGQGLGAGGFVGGGYGPVAPPSAPPGANPFNYGPGAPGASSFYGVAGSPAPIRMQGLPADAGPAFDNSSGGADQGMWPWVGPGDGQTVANGEAPGDMQPTDLSQFGQGQYEEDMDQL